MLFAIESARAIFHRAISEAWVDPPGVADPAEDLFAVEFLQIIRADEGAVLAWALFGNGPSSPAVGGARLPSASTDDRQNPESA